MQARSQKRSLFDCAVQRKGARVWARRYYEESHFVMAMRRRGNDVPSIVAEPSAPRSGSSAAGSIVSMPVFSRSAGVSIALGSRGILPHAEVCQLPVVHCAFSQSYFRNVVLVRKQRDQDDDRNRYPKHKKKKRAHRVLLSRSDCRFAHCALRDDHMVAPSTTKGCAKAGKECTAKQGYEKP